MRLDRTLRKPVRLARRALWRIGLRRQKPWDGRAIALHQHRAIYYLVPKVACSSLTAVCVDMLGFVLAPGAWKPAVFRSDSFDGAIDRNKRDAAKISVANADRLQDYWRFAFVRNPYDRLVSCFSEKLREDGPDGLFVNGVARSLLRFDRFFRGMSFAEFVQAVAGISDEDADPHFRSQVSFVCSSAGELKVDFIGHFESLGADVSRLAERLGVEIELPHLLKSQRDSYEAYYDDATRRIVRDRYVDDFRLLGYEAQ
jgi:hypothetical protein